MEVYSPTFSKTLSPRFSRQSYGSNSLSKTFDSYDETKRQYEQYNELSTLNNTLLKDLETAKTTVKSSKELYKQKIGELNIITSQIEDHSPPFSPIPNTHRVKINPQSIALQRKDSKQNTYNNLNSKIKCITKNTETYYKFLNILKSYQNGDEIIDLYIQELEEEKNELLEEFLGESLSETSTATIDQQSLVSSDSSLSSESSISMSFFTDAVNQTLPRRKQNDSIQYSARTELNSSSLSSLDPSSKSLIKTKKTSMSVRPIKTAVVNDSIKDLENKLERKQSKLKKLKEKSKNLDNEIKFAIKRVDQMKLQDEIDSKTFYHEDVDKATQKSLLNSQLKLHRLKNRKNKHEENASKLQSKLNRALNKTQQMANTAAPQILELSQRLLLVQTKIYDAEMELSNEQTRLEAARNDYINTVESPENAKLIDEKGRSLRDQRMLIKWRSLQSRRLPSEVAKYTMDNSETLQILTEKLEGLEVRALQKEEETQLAIDYQKTLKSVVDYWEER